MPTTAVLDSTMYHEDLGSGLPFVFLHGNPGSSHLWRAVPPAIGGDVRTLAPDLIGMGRSGKPDLPYRFADHARYLDAWFDAVGLDEVVLVGHDWGGALAFDWAAGHPDRVRGIAFFETIVRPMSWAELGPGPRARAELIRGPEGESVVLDRLTMLDTAYTGGVLNPLSDKDMARTRSRTRRGRAGARCCGGPVRCRSTGSPPTSRSGSRGTGGGWPRAPEHPSCC